MRAKRVSRVPRGALIGPDQVADRLRPFREELTEGRLSSRCSSCRASAAKFRSAARTNFARSFQSLSTLALVRHAHPITDRSNSSQQPVSQPLKLGSIQSLTKWYRLICRSRGSLLPGRERKLVVRLGRSAIPCSAAV